MAFPTTGILSTFTGADEEPLSEGGKWGSTLRTASASIDECRLVSNQAGATTVGTTASESTWLTKYGQNMECYVTIIVHPTSSGSTGVWARVQGAGTTATLNAYLLSYTHSTTTILMEKCVNGTFTTLGSSLTQSLTAGTDGLGIEVNGTNITGYFFTGGVWQTHANLTATDTAISGEGILGLSISRSGSVGRADNFGGGNIAVVQPPKPDVDFVYIRPNR